jgi:hypothetical protein
VAVFSLFVGRQYSAADQQSIRNSLLIGGGTEPLFCDCVVEALMHLQPLYLRWSNAAKPREMGNRMEARGFPLCVGIAYGTLFPLMEKPMRKDYSVFHGRKHPYSMTTLIICDNKRNILCHYSGWPGSQQSCISEL